MKYILGFDLGTSSCKAVLYDEDLSFMGAKSMEYRTTFPGEGYAEQSGAQWWEAFCRTTRALIDETGVAPADICCVGIDSQGSVALPVDAQGNCLHNGLLWMDRRAKGECSAMNAALGGRIYEITGNKTDPSDIAPKILWFQKHLPDVYRDTHKFLHANGYLAYMLTGQFSQDATEGGLSLLCDLSGRAWSEEILDALHIDRQKLPDICECHSIVGEVTQSAAAECGLRAGTPVAAGAMDVIASALGTGSVSEGDVYVAGGTVSAVGVVIDKPQPHPLMHIHNHILDGKYVLVSAVDFGGGGLKWLRDTLGTYSYDRLNELAGMAPPGNEGLLFLPYMVGQRSPLYNDNTSGVMFGLTPDHKLQNIVRMFMEGTSYAIKAIFDYHIASGNIPNKINLTGGLSKSAVWSQLLCDILGVDIQVCSDDVDVATMGGAILAGVGSGVFNSYDDALRHLVKAREYRCDNSNAKAYHNAYCVFQDVYHNILPSYDYAKKTLGSLERKS